MKGECTVRSTLRMLLLTLTVIIPFTGYASPVTFYVSMAGDDNWSGRIASPNQSGLDGPFATFSRAQEAVRDLRSTPEREMDTVYVLIREGRYYFRKTLRFHPEDSGFPGAPVIWKNYPGERVVFTGGKSVNGLWPLAESQTPLRDRFPVEHLNHILVANLSGQGITEYGQLKRRGFGVPREPSSLQLFVGEEAMPLARYPDTGWVRITEVPQRGDSLYYPGSARDARYDDIPTGRHYGEIRYPGNRPSHWVTEEDIWVHGFWTHDWADTYEQVESIDTTANLIKIRPPHHRYGYTRNQRFYFLNIPEELNSPGEWYLDRERGDLYFWPPEGRGSQEIVVSILDSIMVNLQQVSYVHFEGIDFRYSRTGMVKITGGTENLIGGCAFRNAGDVPVVIEGGTHNGITGCDLHHLDAGGVSVHGGERSSLTPGYNYVYNCHIYNFGRIYKTRGPAITLTGVGNHLAHNLIHHAPHAGILFKGNEHLIEFNEIYDIARETGDVGAIYTGRDRTARGTLIRYNYLHDLHGPGLHGVRGVYLDDFTSGITVYGNLFYKAGRAAFVGGGRNNLIEANVFSRCSPSIQIDGRGLSWATHYFDSTLSNYTGVLRERMRAVDYDRPPYSRRYPELLGILEDDPAVPKYNVIRNNISWGGIFLDLYDGVDRSVVTIEDNLIADTLALRMSEKSDHFRDFVLLRRDEPHTVERLSGNAVLTRNPGYVDSEDLRRGFVAGSPAMESLDATIPIHRIGLQTSSYRSKR